MADTGLSEKERKDAEDLYVYTKKQMRNTLWRLAWFEVEYSDWEKSISDEQIRLIQELCGSLSDTVQFMDMYAAEEFVPIESREKVFRQKIEQFKRASLVVTDRLHGMVFSAITGTPCVALSNYNHKVRETYRWLQQLPYIRFCEVPEEAVRVIPELYRLGGGSYDDQFSEPYFEKIANYIKNYLQ